MSELIHIKSYDNIVEADLDLNLLRANEIEAFLKNEYVGSLSPHLGTSIGNIKLFVVDRDAKDAEELLNFSAVDDAIRCPNCEASNYSEVRSLKTDILRTIYASILAPNPAQLRCNACGHLFVK